MIKGFKRTKLWETPQEDKGFCNPSKKPAKWCLLKVLLGKTCCNHAWKTGRLLEHFGIHMKSPDVDWVAGGDKYKPPGRFLTDATISLLRHSLFSHAAASTKAICELRPNRFLVIPDKDQELGARLQDSRVC